MNRVLTLLFAMLGCACNAAPPSSCTQSANSVIAAGTPAESCPGVCINTSAIVGDVNGSAAEVCTLDCTDAGNSVCVDGTVCTSGEPYTSHSYCLVPCSGAAGACPNGLLCVADAGVCL